MAALFMYLCKNCGIILDFTEAEAETGEHCDCGNPDLICLDVNPVEYYEMSQERKNSMICQTLNISQKQLEDKQIEWKKIREAVDREYHAKRVKELNAQRKANLPKCPTCGSTNVHPISVTKKATGFVLAGIFSSNFGKSYECKNCKYKW